MRVGVTDYVIDYSDTVPRQSAKFNSSEYLFNFLPVDMVTTLASLSYKYPDIKQPVLDALSSFQILSKLWAASVMSKVIVKGSRSRPFVHFGSWFGQLNCIMARQVPEYLYSKIVLIDQDPLACLVAREVIKNDYFFNGSESLITVITGDALDFSLKDFADTLQQKPVVLWTGVEHFKYNDVADYIDRYADVGATYLLQGTDMPAEDHVCPITSCNQLEQYFDGTPLYSASLKADVGTRFQIVFDT